MCQIITMQFDYETHINFKDLVDPSSVRIEGLWFVFGLHYEAEGLCHL